MYDVWRSKSVQHQLINYLDGHESPPWRQSSTGYEVVVGGDVTYSMSIIGHKMSKVKINKGYESA